MQKIVRQFALSTLMLAAAAAAAAASPSSSFSGLVFFGDSLSDAGNNALILGNTGVAPANDGTFSQIPYASGRYSNGPVWSEYFASKLGLSATASLAGGSNYAFGGAQTGLNGTETPDGFPYSLRTQLNMFLGNPGTTVSSGQLFILSGGGNNVRATLDAVQADPAHAGDLIAAAAAAYAQDMGDMVDALQARGAQHILVVNTPNFGLTPSALSHGPMGQYLGSAAASAMDMALAQRMVGEAGVMSFDSYAFLTQTVAGASGLGLSNVSNACGNLALGCDLNTSFFYDSIHPTTVGHKLLADAIYTDVMAQSVPEPASYAMLGLGLGVLAWARRRQLVKG